MTKEQIIKKLRDMAKHPTVTLPRDCEALRAAADLLAQPEQEQSGFFSREAMKAHSDGHVAQPKEPEQEPVAWRAPNWGHSDDEWVYRDFDDPVLIADGKPSPNNEALYTHPPQRTWVGLTDEEFQYCVELKNPESIAEEVEAKLRSKNI